MHLKTSRFPLAEGQAPILHQLTVQDECWEVEEADCYGRLHHIEKVLREGHLVDEELKLEEVLARLPHRLLHLGPFRVNCCERHLLSVSCFANLIF